MDSFDFWHAARNIVEAMMHHCILWYFVTDAIADFRAWLWECYADGTVQLEEDIHAVLRKAKKKEL